MAFLSRVMEQEGSFSDSCAVTDKHMVERESGKSSPRFTSLTQVCGEGLGIRLHTCSNISTCSQDMRHADNCNHDDPGRTLQDTEYIASNPGLTRTNFISQPWRKKWGVSPRYAEKALIRG